MCDHKAEREGIIHYHIRVKGHLGASWQEWFNGLQITKEEEGTTLLSGSLQDQAALYGVLLKIRSLNLTLLSLETQAQSEVRSPKMA